MALTKCKECGEQISTKADACPKCGAKLAKKTSAFTWLVLILIIVGVWEAANMSPSPSSSSSSSSSLLAPRATIAGEWYEGGTLHKATGQQWQAASHSNRLATSADFVAATVKPSSMSELRTKATSMERCVTEATRGPESVSLKASELAAACVILLGW